MDAIEVLKYALLPAVAVVASHLAPSLGARPSVSAVIDFQYFAAGIVIAAVSAELLPQIFARHNALWVILGFVAGILLPYVSGYVFEKKNHLPGLPLLAARLTENTLLGGILIGAGFAAGRQQGRLLSIALVGRATFIGLDTASARRSMALGSSVLMASASAALAACAVLVYRIIPAVPHPVLDVLLALGISGILYLTIRDVLLEIQDESQAGFRTGVFCAGFALFLVLHMLAIGPTEPELIP